MPTLSEPGLATFAQQLAAAGSRRDAQATIARWLHGRTPATVAAPAVNRGTTPNQIGIWRRSQRSGQTVFVRDDTAIGADMWADAEQIGPKRGRRVVLIGESCARGWPLDPLFNCASALTAYLRSVSGGDDVEVVDLARNGIKPAGLLAVLQASMALEPDACVIFASNNFRVDTRELDVAAVAAELTASRRWRSVVPHVERILRRQLATWMADMAGILRACRVPAVFVIPGENLQDQHLPCDLYNPLLDSRDQIAHEELLTGIETLANNGEWDAVETRARALVALEDGCSVAGLQWLGRAAVARKANAEAVSCFEQAREIAFLGIHAYAPRLDELRIRAAEQGFRVVDLPRAFIEDGDGQPPGRTLFLDACHMTSAAIATAMATTTEQLLPLLDLPATSRADLLQVPLAVEPRAEAQAHFIASVVIDDEALCRHHLQRALQSTPDILDVLLSYADLRLRPVPPVLSEASDRLTRLHAKFPALKYRGTWPRWHTRETWIRVVGDMLAHHDPDVVASWRGIVSRTYPLEERAIDLIPFARAGDFTLLSPTGGYVKCFRRRTHFRIDRHTIPESCRLRLTTRGRERGAIGQRALLFVNGTLAHTWRLQASWATEECTIATTAGEAIDLTIVWPSPGVSRDDSLTRVAEAFAHWTQGTDALEAFELGSHLYAIWGEVHAFTARAVPPEEARCH
jgi:hypothetical protein